MAQEPNGDIAPLDGNLEIDSNKLLDKPFSIYIHVRKNKDDFTGKPTNI